MSSKLATFRIEEEEWKEFQLKADEQGSSASALLVAFVKWTNAGNTLPRSDAELAPDIDSRIEERVLQALAPIQSQLEELRQMIPVSTAPRDASEIPLEELQLSVRSALILERAQVKNASHLLLFNERYLLGMLGEAGAKEVKDALQRLGFTLPPGEQVA